MHTFTTFFSLVSYLSSAHGCNLARMDPLLRPVSPCLHALDSSPHWSCCFLPRYYFFYFAWKRLSLSLSLSIQSWSINRWDHLWPVTSFCHASSISVAACAFATWYCAHITRLLLNSFVLNFFTRQHSSRVRWWNWLARRPLSTNHWPGGCASLWLRHKPVCI